MRKPMRSPLRNPSMLPSPLSIRLRPRLRPRLRLPQAVARPQPPRRPFASLIAHGRVEQLVVPCRSNGAIRIDIYHALSPASPVLIYLPSGPIIPDYAEEEERIISTLASSSGATIARINYRCSPTHQYPTPIHDVLLGYDWVRENLLRDAFSRPVLGHMGVCGELVGGSLAVMLALTECRLGESRIGAASVNNPIADWVFSDDLPIVPASELPEPLAPEETAFPAEEDPMSPTTPRCEPEVPLALKSTKRPPKPPPPTAWQTHGHNAIIPAVTLSGERDVLFSRPEHYFDRFASPIHFFRSPHGHLHYPQLHDAFASEQPNSPLDIETQMDVNHFQSSERSPSAPEVPTLTRCRAYARIYPPAASNLSMPSWHVTTGTESPLSDQASELSKMLKRSIARQTLKSRTGRARWHDASEKERFEEFADGRVQLDTVQGTGLWTQQDAGWDWKARVERTGAWMKERLRPDFK